MSGASIEKLQRVQSLVRRSLFAAVLATCSHAAMRAVTFPHTATVAAVENLTHDTKRMRFRVDKGQTLRFSAGQFVMLSVPEKFVQKWNSRYKTSHTEIARPYSFASSPSRLPLFDLIVKLAGPPPGKDVPPGVASSYVHQLNVGDSVRFSHPAGSLSASVDTGRPLIMAAGGTGVAPFLSFFQSWFESDVPHRSRIYLFFGVRSRRDLFLHDQFRSWASTRKDFTYIPALSHPADADAWSGETGYINVVLDKHIGAPSDADAFVAGSPAMLREVQKVLISKGITQERIQHDPISVQ